MNKKEKNRVALLVLVLGVLIGATVFKYYPFNSKSANAPTASPNRLNLTGTGNGTFQPVSFNAPTAFKDMRPEELQSLRQQALTRIPGFLATPEYKLSDAVFENIDWKAPWLTLKALFYIGKRKVSSRNDDGGFATASSLSLLNPALLVQPTFWGLSIWDESKRFKLRNDLKGDPAVVPLPTKILFNQGEKKIEVTYDITTFLSTIQPLLAKDSTPPTTDISVSLAAHNARDLNLNYLAIDLSSSSGITVKKSTIPVPNLDRYEWSFLPWLKEKKVNFDGSPVGPLSRVIVNSLPARITLKLWESEPDSLTVPHQFTYTIFLN